jgi:hypothetical protein
MKHTYFSEDLSSKGINWSNIRKRLNKERRAVARVPTGWGSFDQLLGGGVPSGLLVIYGDPGTGKSKLTKMITQGLIEQDMAATYFVGDDTIDAPQTIPGLLNIIDFVAYKMSPERACKSILMALTELQPNFAVLDSISTIFGATIKAVPEAELREWVQVLAQHVSGKIPVIGISETRGTGYNYKPAGGTGVLFPAITNIHLQKVRVKHKWDAHRYGAREGEYRWLITVTKDRDGVAMQNRDFILEYIGDEPLVTEIQHWTGDDEDGKEY